jgi:oligogalacturonide transporter
MTVVSKEQPTGAMAPLKSWQLAAYGVGDFFGGGSFFIIGFLYLFFMTDVVGMKPSHAGLIFVLGKLWDAVCDPVIGYLSDTIRTRFGRRRIFFLFGAIPAGLSFALLWLPVRGYSETLTFLYYLASFLFFTTVFAVLMIPYSALVAEIHPADRERTRLTGARIFFSQVAALVGGVVPKTIIAAFPDAGQGHLMMGMIFGAAFVIPWLIVFAGTREMELPKTAREISPARFVREILVVFKNPVFRVHLAMYLAAYTAMDVIMATLQYFVKYTLQKEAVLTMALGTLLVAQVIALPVHVWLANRRGKGFAFVLGLSIWGVGTIATSLIPAGFPTAALLALCAVVGVGLSAGVMIPWAILPMVGDVDELMSGARRVGIYSGVMTLVRKLVQAVAVYSVSLGLQLVGYAPGVEQSATTRQAFRILFGGVSSLLIVVGIVMGLRFVLTPKVWTVVSDELRRRRAGNRGGDGLPETRQICERVTGMSFERLYGG